MIKNFVIIILSAVSCLTTANAQYYAYTDLHYTGTSTLDNIHFERIYIISKTAGKWCKNYKYTLKIPKFYDRTTLHNTLDVYVVNNHKYSVTVSSPYISKTVNQSTGTTYGNEYLIIDMQVNSETVGNSFTVKVGYDLKSRVNVNMLNPNDVYPLTTVPTDIKNTFTVKTSIIDSDNTSIINKAKEIIGVETSQKCIVQLLAEWIKGNIAYALTPEADEKASVVLANRQGDCDAQSNLMIAFCRSLGIPARLVTGYSIKMELKYPTKNGFLTFGPGYNGTQPPGFHGYYDIYYPSIGTWVAGDPAMSTLHFSHVTNIMEGQGKDLNWTKEANANNLTMTPGTLESGEIPPVGLDFDKNDPTITSSTSNLSHSFKYIYDNTFMGTLNKAGDYLLNSSEIEEQIGIFDKVEIKDLGGIPNTKIIVPGSSVRFGALFTSYYNDTWPVQWNWEIKLYHTGGIYSYLVQSFATSAMSFIWSPTNLGSPPNNYNWLFDENGNIYGEVQTTVYINDGDMKADKVPVGVVCKQIIENYTYQHSQTVEGCYINLQNVTIQNNSNIIFKSPGDITIKQPFEVKTGSTFELRKQ